MQKSLDEVREFLKAATGGRFGAPSLVNRSSTSPARRPTARPPRRSRSIEISDYHCPFCRRHLQQTQPQLNPSYVNTGKVRHVFLHYPIEQLHPDAFRSHEAAAARGDQGKFWDLHDQAVRSPGRDRRAAHRRRPGRRARRDGVPRVPGQRQARAGSAGERRAHAGAGRRAARRCSSSA